MVNYEWDVELIDEHGDIIDHQFCNTFSETRLVVDEYSLIYKCVIVLVRDDNVGRSWAYYHPTEGLEHWFHNTYQKKVVAVPTRFHKEIAKALGKQE